MPHLRFCWFVDYVGRISQLCALKTFNRGRSTGLLRILLARANQSVWSGTADALEVLILPSFLNQINCSGDGRLPQVTAMLGYPVGMVVHHACCSETSLLRLSSLVPFRQPSWFPPAGLQ
jgi:hypothetical protein